MSGEYVYNPTLALAGLWNDSHNFRNGCAELHYHLVWMRSDHRRRDYLVNPQYSDISADISLGDCLNLLYLHLVFCL